MTATPTTIALAAEAAILLHATASAEATASTLACNAAVYQLVRDAARAAGPGAEHVESLRMLADNWRSTAQQVERLGRDETMELLPEDAYEVAAVAFDTYSTIQGVAGDLLAEACSTVAAITGGEVPEAEWRLRAAAQVWDVAQVAEDAARASRNCEVRAAVAGGVSMYRAAQVAGLSRPAVSKIVA